MQRARSGNAREMGNELGTRRRNHTLFHGRLGTRASSATSPCLLSLHACSTMARGWMPVSLDLVVWVRNRIACRFDESEGQRSTRRNYFWRCSRRAHYRAPEMRALQDGRAVGDATAIEGAEGTPGDAFGCGVGVRAAWRKALPHAATPWRTPHLSSIAALSGRIWTREGACTCGLPCAGA